MGQPLGAGPGEITEDGCAVDFYALLPAMGEPEKVHSAAPEGASILELGCGTGRILRPLAKLGHPVTGVDYSQAMLAHLHDLPTFCSRVEDVRLGRTFDVVLLAASMLNSEPAKRHAFLATCRAHLHDDGIAVFEHRPPSWFDVYESVPRDVVGPGGIRRVLRSVRREGPRMYVEQEYHVSGRVWSQSSCSYEIGPEELSRDLAAAGLRLDRWLTDDHYWFTARPA